jgi:hypothetical protein
MRQDFRQRTAAPRNNIHWQGIRQILDHEWRAGGGTGDDSGGRVRIGNKETAR